MYACGLVWGNIMVDGGAGRRQRNAQKLVTVRGSQTRNTEKQKNKVVIVKGEDGHGSEGRARGCGTKINSCVHEHKQKRQRKNRK